MRSWLPQRKGNAGTVITRRPPGFRRGMIARRREEPFQAFSRSAPHGEDCARRPVRHFAPKNPFQDVLPTAKPPMPFLQVCVLMDKVMLHPSSPDGAEPGRDDSASEASGTPLCDLTT